MPAQSFEVIVVDDGSEDDTAERLAGFVSSSYGFQYIRQENQGPATARNEGIRVARAPIVVFFDDDCMPEPACLERLVGSLAASDDSVAGCGGNTVRNVESLVSRYVDRIGVLRPQAENSVVLYLITCNAAFRRSVLMEVNGFCGRFTCAGGEDPEICIRMAELGYTFMVREDAVVLHDHPSGFSALFRMYSRYGRGLCVFHELGRKMPSVTVPYPGYLFLRHFRWPGVSITESLGYVFCEAVKNAGLISALLKARLSRRSPQTGG